MSSETNRPVIEAEGIGKSYRLYDRPHERLLQMLRPGRRYGTELTVLRDVSFEVDRGETVGIVGRNGAGKSTLLRILAGVLTPSTGRVAVRGRIAPLIELGSGFNPELTGRENVIFNGMLLGMAEREVLAKFDRIAAFADIGDWLDRPVKTYSSGMFARLAFSVAIHVDPDVLIVDEILSVGDAAFQRKCIRRFHEVREAGCTILLVAHDDYMVRALCRRALYLREGRMVAFGAPEEVVGRYVHDTMPAPPQAAAPAAPAPAFDAKADAIRLHGFALLDEAGRRVEVAQHGATLRLRFDFEVLRPEEMPDEVSFVFNLYTTDGTYVCGATTLMDRLPPHPTAPAGRVEVTFPALPLLTGAYHWRVAVNDGQGLMSLKEVKGVCPFRVEEAEYRSAGLVHLERRWKVELAAPAEAAG